MITSKHAEYSFKIFRKKHICGFPCLQQKRRLKISQLRVQFEKLEKQHISKNKLEGKWFRFDKKWKLIQLKIKDTTEKIKEKADSLKTINRDKFLARLVPKKRWYKQYQEVEGRRNYKHNRH